MADGGFKITATALGMDGVSLDAEKTSNPFSIESVTNIRIEGDFTHSSATVIDTVLQTTSDDKAAVDAGTARWIQARMSVISSLLNTQQPTFICAVFF